MSEPVPTAELANPISESDKLFRTDHLHANLKQRSVRGGVVTISAQAVKFVLTLVSTMALARLLTPADFGIVAMVAPITGFIALFKDLGLSMATVQKETITHAQVSTLFWINVAVSLFLALLAAAISPLVGLFYQDPRTTWITLATAATFIFGGLTAQHQALLARQMRFTTLAIIDVVTMASGIVAGIITAYIGWSYWSLVAMSATSGLVNTAAVWIASPWMPGKISRGAGSRSMLAFGGALTGFTLSGYIANNFDKIFIGRILGVDSLGIYSRAGGILFGPIQQFLSPVTSVLVPVLCRVRTDLQRFERLVLNTEYLLLMITTPISATLVVLSDETVYILLGPKWRGAGMVFQALCFSILTLPVNGLCSTLIQISGESKIIIRWGITYAILTIAAILFGLPWGILGVAYSVSISGLLIRSPAIYWFASKSSQLSMLRLMQPVLVFLIPFLLILGIGFPLRLALTDRSVPQRMIAVIAVAGIVYLVFLAVSGIFKLRVRPLLLMLRPQSGA